MNNRPRLKWALIAGLYLLVIGPGIGWMDLIIGPTGPVLAISILGCFVVNNVFILMNERAFARCSGGNDPGLGMSAALYLSSAVAAIIHVVFWIIVRLFRG